MFVNHFDNNTMNIMFMFPILVILYRKYTLVKDFDDSEVSYVCPANREWWLWKITTVKSLI